MSSFWNRRETELEREIAHHLHHLAAEYERQGHSREEALRLAKREFGGSRSGERELPGRAALGVDERFAAGPECSACA